MAASRLKVPSSSSLIHCNEERSVIVHCYTLLIVASENISYNQHSGVAFVDIVEHLIAYTLSSQLVMLSACILIFA
jgi:hypothetical protein